MAAIPVNASKIGVSGHLSASVRNILIWPTSSLNEPSVEVTEFDDELGQLIMDMFLTMDTNNGVGLAAPQVGINKNIITIGVRKHYALENPGTTPTEYGNSFIDHKVMINPKILGSSEQLTQNEEGCLSVPGYFENRMRPREIIVEWQDPHERFHSEEFQGMEAFVIQHEMDHLKGKLFIDDLSKLKKDRVKKKVAKELRRLRCETVVI